MSNKNLVESVYLNVPKNRITEKSPQKKAETSQRETKSLKPKTIEEYKDSLNVSKSPQKSPGNTFILKESV